MKITRKQLGQIISEALEVHHDSHSDDPDLDDDGFLSVAELVSMVHGIVDDNKVTGVDPAGYIDTFPEEYSNLDKTNITKDEAFSAGCSVCGSQARDDCDQKVGDNTSTNLQRTFEKEAQAKSAALSSASTLAKSLEGAGTTIDDWLLGRVYAALLRMSRLLQGRTISGKYKDALGTFQISEGKMKITRKQLRQIIKEEISSIKELKSGGAYSGYFGMEMPYGDEDDETLEEYDVQQMTDLQLQLQKDVASEKGGGAAERQSVRQDQRAISNLVNKGSTT